MRHRGAVIVIAICALASGLSFALQTSTEFSSKTDFNKFKTWSWGPADVPGNPKAEKRIHDDVEAQLAARGWKKIDEGQGDAVVSVHGVVKDVDNYDVLYSGWAPGWNWSGVGIGSGVGTTVQSRVRQGTLVIDVFDAASKSLVWRGTAEGTVGAPSEVEANMKKIDQAIEKLLKRFPPTPDARTPDVKAPDPK
jgi:hypothetical protein